MDLELGLKITHTVDDHVSSANFRIAKDRSGPLFVSKETESMFILTGHLKGYRKERVCIDINEDGTQIGISGEKPVQEKVMSGWIMHKKEVEMRGFRKVFRIPDGVVLDRIKAKFNVHESSLTIVMPKSVKGSRGVGIEEVKEDEVDTGKRQLTQPPTAEEVPEKDGFRGKIEGEIGETEKTKVEENRRTDAKGVDDVIGKDTRGSTVKEEAKDSKAQSTQHKTKSVSENNEESKVAKVEEADVLLKEKVGRKELETDQTVANRVRKRENAEVTREVYKPSQENQVTAKHDTTEENSSELPKLEAPKAGIEEHVRNGQESGESSKQAEDTTATQQEAKVQREKNADGIRREGDAQLPKQESIKEGQGSGVQERAKNEEHIKEKEEDESSEMEEQSDVDDKKSSDDQENKDGKEKSNLLCSPFIIAGSALIVSLVMLAINKIRTRKR
ncbi:hypothetical protein D8674_025796 [Pyrus ussuriensis x Pyrus communis]|uniref:SHSP domain-containing protein n=1 Tax=Pyrus ussuriensis x Pyrus communis TaxID=2448454 RepID=A0A5N5I9W9_9ROSA|nr:hypothetical protein D8674_025796 [Pyrus ussuriensis x Pyrus communis]